MKNKVIVLLKDDVHFTSQEGAIWDAFMKIHLSQESLRFVADIKNGVALSDLEPSPRTDFVKKLLKLNFLKYQAIFDEKIICTVFSEYLYDLLKFSADYPKTRRLSPGSNLQFTSSGGLLIECFHSKSTIEIHESSLWPFILELGKGCSRKLTEQESFLCTLLHSVDMLTVDKPKSVQNLEPLDGYFHYRSNWPRSVKDIFTVVANARKSNIVARPQAGSISLARHTAPEISYNDLRKRRHTTRSFESNKDLTLADIERLLCLSVLRSPGFNPYPSPGNLYSLEFYCGVYHVAGLESDIYHYDSVSHCLVKKNITDDLRKLIQPYQTPVGDSNTPAMILFITTRIGEIMQRYQRVAYRVALIESGVVLQNLYLAAAALNLGIRPRGSANRYYVEEDILGIKDRSELSLLEVEVGNAN